MTPWAKRTAPSLHSSTYPHRCEVQGGGAGQSPGDPLAPGPVEAALEVGKTWSERHPLNP